MKELKIIVGSAVIMAAFAGCVDKAPNTADFMRMHAAEEKATGVDQKEIAKEWDRGLKLKMSGEKLIKSGEALIKSGDKDMTKGKQQVEQGEKDVLEGTKIEQDSERKFREKYPDLKLEIK